MSAINRLFAGEGDDASSMKVLLGSLLRPHRPITFLLSSPLLVRTLFLERRATDEGKQETLLALHVARGVLMNDQLTVRWLPSWEVAAVPT